MKSCHNILQFRGTDVYLANFERESNSVGPVQKSIIFLTDGLSMDELYNCIPPMNGEVQHFLDKIVSKFQLSTDLCETHVRKVYLFFSKIGLHNIGGGPFLDLSNGSEL